MRGSPRARHCAHTRKRIVHLRVSILAYTVNVAEILSLGSYLKPRTCRWLCISVLACYLDRQQRASNPCVMQYLPLDNVSLLSSASLYFQAQSSTSRHWAACLICRLAVILCLSSPLSVLVAIKCMILCVCFFSSLF